VWRGRAGELALAGDRATRGQVQQTIDLEEFMSFNACVGTARAAGALAAIALVPSAAWAAPGLGQDEIPAGHLYFSFTAQAVQPFGRALIPREQLTLGRGGGLYLDYEGEHFLIGAEIGGGRFGHDDTYSNPFILAIRAGPVFGSGRYAPYLAGGLAMLAYGAIGDDAATATGLGGEVGLLLFRDLRWFRLTAFLQYNLPLAGGGGKGVENVTSLSCGALGVRLQL
jgi:hypothetical protein